MRRVVCPELGPLEALTVETLDDPVPASGQVVVAVAAAGVNYVDGLICLGRYQLRPPVPFVPGGEVAGVVASVGDGVGGLSVGQRVMALTGAGGFSSHVAVPAAAVVPVPASVDLAVAAAFTQAYCTARFALVDRGALAAGERVLVLGAGGGVGLAAVDLAVALGARVVAAASTDAKRAAALAVGAESAVDYEAVDLKEAVRRLTDGGVDVVVDPVGGRHSEPALRALRPFGRHLVLGFTAGEVPSLPSNLALLRNRAVVGVDWGAWVMAHPAAHRAMLADLLAMVADEQLHPTQPQTAPLEAAAGVLGDLVARRRAGKVVLVP